MRIMRQVLRGTVLAAVLVLAALGAARVLDGVGLLGSHVVRTGPPDVEMYAQPPQMVVTGYGPHGFTYAPAPPVSTGVARWAGMVAVAGMAVAIVMVLLLVVYLLRQQRVRSVRYAHPEGDAPPDELTLMRDLHASLGRMEQRVEALETILLDRTGRHTTSRL